MIPMFKAKEDEATNEFSRIQIVKDELQRFKEKLNIKSPQR